MIANSTSKDSTWVLARFLKHLKTNAADQDLFSSLRHGICNEHRVTSIEELLEHTIVKLIQKHYQNQDEEHWAKDRALLHVTYRDKPHVRL